jgi:hypothetical protein
MATVQEGQHHEHGRACGHNGSDTLYPQATLGGVGGTDELGLGRLFLSADDLAGLGPDGQLIDGAGQVSARQRDLSLDGLW